MRRIFCAIIAAGWLLAGGAAAQAVPTCRGDEPPARDLRLHPNVVVLADSAFPLMSAAERDFDSVTVRFRARVDAAGRPTVLCRYEGTQTGAMLLASAASHVRFGREMSRPFRDTATVDLTLATSRPANGAPVAETRRVVSIGQGVRVEVARVAMSRAAGARLSPGDELAAYHAGLIQVLAEQRALPGVRCVIFTHGGPERELAARLDAPGARVVAGGACPPTRYTGVRTPADPPVPAGWVDPVRIEVAPLDVWSPDTAAFTVGVGHSTRDTRYTCVAARAPAGWRAECRLEWTSIAANPARGTRRARVWAARGETRGG